ncbi:MAG TPA: hypothetical protein VIP11_12460, partial [Gemmatimonadaceae bacterium]
RRHTHVAAVLAVAAVVFAVACGDSPTAPARSIGTDGAPSFGKAPQNLVPAQGLLRANPLLNPIVVVKTIPRGGGGISVPGTDFKLEIPKDAFAEKEMTITITALPGKVVAYDFQPHGVVFLKPLKAVQQLGHTTWKGVKLKKGLYEDWTGAYFASQSQINLMNGRALIDEFMPGGVEIGGATITWYIPHFSGYMVSTGRDEE